MEPKTVHDVAKSLNEIERNMTRWTQHFNGMRVWVRDEDAYLRRLEEWDREHDESDEAAPDGST
jgi:hypothetical protein